MGVPWRATKQDVIKILHLSEESDCLQINGSEACIAPLSLGSVTAKAYFHFHSSRVGSVVVTFNSEDFDFARKVFIKRYGQPSRDSESRLRGNQIVSWKWKGLLLVASKYASSMEEGDAVFLTEWAVAESKKLERAQTENAMRSLDSPPLNEATPAAPAVSPQNPFMDDVLVTELGLVPNMKSDDVLQKLGSPSDIRQSYLGTTSVEVWGYGKAGYELYFAKPKLTLYGAWRHPK